ncbi:MAG: 30S ribosomal protein S6e [Candidatus Altiarchaeota archaeon]|nr:30S ribosomal protein S6e [Candidatus Altiarchaeota archaeon]
MECKIVISDPETGKSYQKELKDDRAKHFKSLKIGSEFDGGVLGLADYKLSITGGSDRSGFPMRRGIHGTTRSMVLSKGGVGYNPLKSERIRKRMRGEMVSDDISQINVKIIKKGSKSLEESLGIAPKEEKKAEEKPAE